MDRLDALLSVFEKARSPKTIEDCISELESRVTMEYSKEASFAFGEFKAAYEKLMKILDAPADELPPLGPMKAYNLDDERTICLTGFLVNRPNENLPRTAFSPVPVINLDGRTVGFAYIQDDPCHRVLVTATIVYSAPERLEIETGEAYMMRGIWKGEMLWSICLSRALTEELEHTTNFVEVAE